MDDQGTNRERRRVRFFRETLWSIGCVLICVLLLALQVRPRPSGDPGYTVYAPVLCFAAPGIVFVLAVAIVAASEMKDSPRFSLQAMLSIVTLVAVILGVIAWMVKK